MPRDLRAAMTAQETGLGRDGVWGTECASPQLPTASVRFAGSNPWSPGRQKVGTLSYPQLPCALLEASSGIILLILSDCEIFLLYDDPYQSAGKASDSEGRNAVDMIRSSE